jgi:hypothetical protein
MTPGNTRITPKLHRCAALAAGALARMNKHACLRGSRGDSRGKVGSLTTEWFREHKEPVVQRGAVLLARSAAVPESTMSNRSPAQVADHRLMIGSVISC